MQGEVNEEWLGHLEDLHNKLEFVRKSKLVQVLAESFPAMLETPCCNTDGILSYTVSGFQHDPLTRHPLPAPLFRTYALQQAACGAASLL